ncbi:ArnT family glycosyltransferase [Dictyobacter formicarum]|nr:phospholipid carrier-dependent glycosyltransferase [Dictyobacter formicarum]
MPVHSKATLTKAGTRHMSLTVPQTPPIDLLHDNPQRLMLHRRWNFTVHTTYRPGPNTGMLRRIQLPARPRYISAQAERLSDCETREVPRISLLNPLPGHKFLAPPWVEVATLLLGLLVSLLGHAFNVFQFPRYELDEGTYISSAWAILHGQITPYPYGYGHPPLAWIQLAMLVPFVGGFFTFGNAINTGRVLMLLYALGSSLLVYLIVRRMIRSRSASLLALVLFSLSPLSITYQRQILLDNISTFWLLLSLYLLIKSSSRLHQIVLAALAFGIALLSKEIMLLFLPVMIYATWLYTTPFQRKFALVAFTYTSIALGSSFVLLAILKGELFPYSWHLPWDTHQHLSLLQTYLEQTQRGQDEGSFSGSWQNWLHGDRLLLLASLAAPAFNLVVGWWKRPYWLPGLLAASFWLLLIRGGVVLSFYFIPLIPLTAINVALASHLIVSGFSRWLRLPLMRVVLICAIIATLIPYDYMQATPLFTQQPASAQTGALNWIREHVNPHAFIVINSYLYLDLHEAAGPNMPVFPYANVYFNVATDPELHDKVLHADWRHIEYIVADSEMLNDIHHNSKQMQIIQDALKHARVRQQFKAQDHDQQLLITIYQVQPTLAQPGQPKGNSGHGK